MDMQLTITYKDNHRRVLSLSQEFLNTEYIENHRTKKREPMTYMEKSISLAHYLGTDPYHILLHKGGVDMLDKTIAENRPSESVSRRVPTDIKYIKKELRRLFKGVPTGTTVPEADELLAPYAIA